MLFEAREIQPYAQPVDPSDLRQGQAYFILNYDDADLCLPRMLPVIYIGHNLESGDIAQYYFQDASSYLAGVRRSAEGPDAHGEFIAQTVVKDVFEFERALEVLMCCSLRRRSKASL